MKHQVITQHPEPVVTSIIGSVAAAVGRGAPSVRLPDAELSPWSDLRIDMYPPELHHRVRAALCCGQRLMASYSSEHHGWSRRRALWLERWEPGAREARPVVGIMTFDKLYRVLLKHVLAAWLPDDAGRDHYEALGAALGEARRLPPWPGGWPSWTYLMAELQRIATPGLALLQGSAARRGVATDRLEPALAAGLDRLRLNMFEKLRALEVLGRLAETWRYVTFQTALRAFDDQPTHVHGCGPEIGAWRSPGPLWLALKPAGRRDVVVTTIVPSARVSSEVSEKRFLRTRLANAASRQRSKRPSETQVPAVHQWLFRDEL